MEIKYLVDTCIWRDFHEERFSRNGKPIGMYAAQFIIRAIKEKSIFIISDLIIEELNKGYEQNEIDEIFRILYLNKMIIRIETTKSEHLEARKLSEERNLPLGDCLNAVQARSHDALLITRDMHYFNSLSDITKAKRPEEIS